MKNEKINVLINLIPIKKGGGQQVASNFVIHILQHIELTPIFLVTEDTFIQKLLLELKAQKVYTIKKGLIERFHFQIFQLKKIFKKEKVALIYTLMGPGLLYKNIKSVTGCAYSNLFFPEINFWGQYPFLKRIQLRLIDKYRLATTLKSDAIIFENEAMMYRCQSLFNYPKNKTKLILPSISEYSQLLFIEDEVKKHFKNINVSSYNILMLTGWHKNKNIEMVPFILKELYKNNIYDVCFIISVSPNDPNSIKLIDSAASLGVEKNIVFIDTVAPNALPVLFEKIHAMILLSLLESFSNNIIEAWYFNKPLFISDEEWSMAICKDAAIYVKRNSSEDIAKKIIDFRKDKTMQETICKNAKRILVHYPSPKQKVDLQIDYLKEILNA
jgi:hypothetical protein